MRPEPDPAAERRDVERTLAQIERRIRLNGQIRDLVLAGAIALVVPLSLTVWRYLRPLDVTTAAAVLGPWLVVLGAYAGWRLTRRGSLAGAAASADRRADLKDELTTAHWFTTQGDASPWIDLQIARAARTARALDVDALFPRVVPPAARTAVALAALLVALNLVPISWTRGWLEAGTTPAATLSAIERARLEEALALLARAGGAKDEGVRALIERLLRGELSLAEALQQLEEAEAYLLTDPQQMDEALRRVAEALEQSAMAQGVAESLRRRDLAAAGEQLRDLGRALERERDAERQRRLQESLARAAEQAASDLDRLSKDLDAAADRLGAGKPQGAQQALARAAGELDRLAQDRSRQELARAAGQQLQQVESLLRQQQGRPDRRLDEGAPAPEDQGRRAEDAGRVPAGTPGQALPPGERGDPRTRDDRAAGDLSSRPDGSPPQLEEGPPTRLDVRLREAIVTGQPGAGEPRELPKEEPQRQASRAAQSKVEYRDVGRGRQADDPARLEADEVPWPYRPLVKRYFQVVGPRKPSR